MAHSMNREGFWWSKDQPYLPRPKARRQPWKGQAEFVKRLDAIEAKAHEAHFKGWSDCRCCHQRNGTTEFSAGGWIWPAGLKHYITAHNVRPSLAFQEFILGRQVGKDG